MIFFQQYLHLEALPDKLKSEDSACLPPAAPRVLLEDARESASSHPIRKDLFACIEGVVSDCVFFGGERRNYLKKGLSARRDDFSLKRRIKGIFRQSVNEHIRAVGFRPR